MVVVETRYAVPGWGVGEVWFENGLLFAHDFHFQAGLSAHPPKGAHVPPTGTVAVGTLRETDGFVPIAHQFPLRNVEALIERFRAFLTGSAVSFDNVELDLDWATPFQRELVTTIREVPRGEVVSYSELAALAGRPRAPRAAGALCAANRFAFIVPCHRVVAAHGIGGYGDAGVEVKRKLLALEGVRL